MARHARNAINPEFLALLADSDRLLALIQKLRSSSPGLDLPELRTLCIELADTADQMEAMLPLTRTSSYFQLKRAYDTTLH